MDLKENIWNVRLIVWSIYKTFQTYSMFLLSEDGKNIQTKMKYPFLMSHIQYKY